MSAVSTSLPSLRRSLAAAVGRHWLTVGAFALVAGTGFASGGYFPASWGWVTLGAGWSVAAALLASREATLSRPALVVSAALAALTLWTLAGLIWTTGVTETALEAEHSAVYAAVILAAAACARLGPERLIYGAWSAIAFLCVAGLATRLVPDRWGVIDTFAGNRLSQPIGYWNALGLLAGIGVLLALGLAAHADSRWWRALASASVPPLVTTLYFTYSRGAWVAFLIGLLALVVFDRRHLLVLLAAAAAAPFAAIAVWKAATSPALTAALGSSIGPSAHEGHRLVPILALVSLASGLVTLAATRLDPRLDLTPRARRLVGTAWIILALAALGGALAVAGPERTTHRVWSSFSAEFVTPSASLNGRLFSLSSSGRITQWRVAWREARAHPVLGSGAGTYEQAWYRSRPYAFRVRNAHSLYLEALATLGPPGLLLIVVALVVPLGVAFRRRAEPLTAAAFAALLAYVVHAGIDWDWQLSTVTLAALLCAGFLVAGTERPQLGRNLRAVACGLAVLLAATGIYTIATRLPMIRLDSAAAHGNWAAAERDARRASQLMPWSSEPWLHLGEAELNAGLRTQARAAFERAVPKGGNNWVVWYDLARVSTGTTRAHAIDRLRALDPLAPELAELRG
jgi:hypothetical protein